MNFKDSILTYLDANRHRYVSGEELMEHFAIPRTTLWQSLRSLRSSGFDILSEHGAGYRLGEQCEIYTAAALQARLAHPEAFHIQLHPSLPSTNAALKQLAREGAPEGTVLLTNRQTSGYGRKERTFFSPAGGIYMSLLVRPRIPAARALTLTCAAAVAVVDVIREVAEQNAQIKWVNDIFLNDRKVCGILTEASLTPDGALDYAVVGIGINVFTPTGGFAPAIRHVAGAVYPDGTPMLRQRSTMTVALLDRLFELLPISDAPSVLSAYRNASFLPGRTISVLRDDGSERLAAVLAIDDDYRLQVRYPDGQTEALYSGEVSIKEGDVSRFNREILRNSQLPIDK